MKNMLSKQNILQKIFTMKIIPKKVRPFLNRERLRQRGYNIYDNNVRYSSLCLFTPDPGQILMQFLEMLKQAREDFGIIRENANLKSQLESLQTRIECFKQLTNLQTLQTVNTSIKDNVEEMIENEDSKKRLEDNASLHMQEWTDTKDENVRLKTELMKYG